MKIFANDHHTALFIAMCIANFKYLRVATISAAHVLLPFYFSKLTGSPLQTELALG